MGLLKILSKIKEKEKEIRILMLGLDNAGKTTIVKRFNGENIDEIAPTLGFNIKTFFFQNHQLNLWDVGGQKSLRSYWRNYFEENDGLIWVVDSADRRRLQDCKNELYALLKEEKLAGASLLIFVNKQDLSGALSVTEVAELLDLQTLCGGSKSSTSSTSSAPVNKNENENTPPSPLKSEDKKNRGTTVQRHWKVVGCSAVSGAGLEEGMTWLVNDISSRIFMFAD